MSITILNQAYDEARRLAVAGSAVARGDFRLKKLLPQLDQAGAKAPVFAKVADAARAVVNGPEESSAASLLELAALVTAVLYTQGETGIAGPLEPIETIDLGGAATQTSARLLKPLLEALTSTGSGRLELIKDAHQRGAFRDLRLVTPALDALDDPYPEIADFLAESVLPMYGAAVLPTLRAKFDPKGTKGHPRRLRLMHALDPAGTRDRVTQALDTGSKEVRVAAIECLGGSPEDLSYLVEQVSAKAKEVRAAAYRALAAMGDPAVADVLKAAIAGKDIDLAAAAIARSKNDSLPDLLIAEIRRAWAAFPKLKDKQQVSDAAGRLCSLIAALPGREHPAADELTLDLFARRGELTKAKGENLSGSDVAERVVARMASGPTRLRVTLARAHAELDTGELATAVRGAVWQLPPAEVYDLFSRYVAAKVDEKKKGKDSTWARREAVIGALGGNANAIYPRLYPGAESPPIDPRWLDLAVRVKHLGLVHAVGRPGNPAAEAFLEAAFDMAFEKAKDPDSVRLVVTVMVRLGHPKATDALIAASEKTVGKAGGHFYWYCQLVPELPKSAIPRLDAVVPKLKDREADHWVAAIQQLRAKD